MVSPQATQPGNTPHPRPTDWQRGDTCPCTPQDLCHCDGTTIEQCGCYRHELIAQQRRDDSVRITAKDVPASVRRQILREHYEQRALLAKATAIEARNNRDSLTIRYRNNPEAVRPYQVDEANRQLTAARTVEQDVNAMVAVYTDNRDFRGVAR